MFPASPPVPEALQRLDALVKSRGLAVFASKDFRGDAAKVGLRMRATQLPIFDNRLAQHCDRSFVEALAWEDVQVKVWLSYKAPKYSRSDTGCAMNYSRTSQG
jgi:hypothetical protein